MQHSVLYPDVADANGVTLLTRKRVYILPTRHGLAFAIVLMVMLAGSMNYNNALGFALTFLLVSLALVSLLHTYRNLAGLCVSAHPAAPVFAGNEARFSITIDNPGGPRRDGVVITEQRASNDAVVHLHLAPDSNARVELPVVTEQRGWRKLDRVCIASRAPFGIFRAWYRVPTAVRSIVYPHPIDDLPLPVHDTQAGAEGGRGGTGREDFAGLRDYRRGDPVRHIHWKVAARGGAWPLKLFDGARTGDVVLRFVDTPSGDVERRLSQLAAWVLAAEAKGLHYTLELPGTAQPPTTDPDTGPAHRDQCLRRLALFGIAQ
ncbi:MAG: hypothetical protein ACI8W7_003169 [Gammaproteobacteria bacterium]|jgi:uncharacterized protein (DUF58 family)